MVNMGLFSSLVVITECAPSVQALSRQTCFSLAKVFVPAFYSQKDTKTPLYVGMCAVVLNLILNITFILTFPQPVKHAGIAFATVLSSAFNMTCLALILQRRIGPPDWKRIGFSAIRALAAALLMAGVAVFVFRLFPAGGKVAQVVAVLGSIAAAAATYFASSVLLRAPEITEFITALRR